MVLELKDTRNKELIGKIDEEVLSNYPYELLRGRELLEMSYVFVLWKNPELFEDFSDINPSTDLITYDGRFFYDIGNSIYKLGTKVIDDASIHSFLRDDEELLEKFKKKGGYKVYQSMKKILDVDNAEAYYDSLVKMNILLNLHSKGFSVVENLEKLTKMTTSQIYAFFEYHLDNTFLNRGSGVQIVDLTIDDEWIEECESGSAKGLSYSDFAPIMNYHTLGIHRSNVTVFAGYSGTGKSSFTIHTYLLSILRAGEKLAIVANEMNINAWKHILVATVLSKELKYYGLPRKKMKTGGFSEEQRTMIKKAQEYINREYAGRLKFVKIFDYSIEDVKRVFKKLAKQGFTYGLYDTFKAEDASSGNVTGELIEASKQLLQVAEKEDIGIIITMQLAIHTENQRFLTGNTLSNSKGVKEVVSELILMRKLWDDEYTEEQYDVKPWRHKRDAITGKITKGKEYFTLDKEKKYRVVFIDKTRNDDDGVTILYEFNGAWNDWKEIGYCTVSHKNRQ